MSNKRIIHPYRLATALDLSASANSSTIFIPFHDRVGIAVNVLTGSAAGTVKIQGRVSYSGADIPVSQGPSTEWCDLPNFSQALPASSASILFDVGYTGCSELRAVYTRASGSGTADIWVILKRAE